MSIPSSRASCRVLRADGLCTLSLAVCRTRRIEKIATISRNSASPFRPSAFSRSGTFKRQAPKSSCRLVLRSPFAPCCGPICSTRLIPSGTSQSQVTVEPVAARSGLQKNGAVGKTKSSSCATGMASQRRTSSASSTPSLDGPTTTRTSPAGRCSSSCTRTTASGTRVRSVAIFFFDGCVHLTPCTAFRRRPACAPQDRLPRTRFGQNARQTRLDARLQAGGRADPT